MPSARSLPMQGEWIEIPPWTGLIGQNTSLPMQGEWIEMNCSAVRVPMLRSLPMQGEWIEIKGVMQSRGWSIVSPHAGRVD